MSEQSPSKQAAAEVALRSFVKDRMTVALGSGSTAEVFVRLLGAQVQQGAVQAIRCVASSHRTAEVARESGLSLHGVAEFSSFDLMVDGADEVDNSLRAIKGGGGCHYREKTLAQMTKQTKGQLVLIVDKSKCVETLGKFPLPIEVVPFACQATEVRVQKCLQGLGYSAPVLCWRMAGDGKPYKTDNENFILDCALKSIADPEALGRGLKQITGVVEHGLFLDEADAVIIGTPDGSTETRTRTSAKPVS